MSVRTGCFLYVCENASKRKWLQAYLILTRVESTVLLRGAPAVVTSAMACLCHLLDFQFYVYGCGCCLKGLLGRGSVLLSSVKGHYLFYVVPGFLEWRYLVAVFAYVAVAGIVCCQG